MMRRSRVQYEGGEVASAAPPIDQLCGTVESYMDELVRLVEEETALVRSGKLFAAGELETRKSECARNFLNGLEAIKKIRPALERNAPGAVARLQRRHEEFRAMLQVNLAVLATAREVSDNLITSIAQGTGRGAPTRGYGRTGAMPRDQASITGLAVDRSF